MLTLQPVDRRAGLSKEEFLEQYLEPQKPVILTDLMDSWPAKEKWTMEFFKENYGDLMVPVFSANYSKPGKGYMTPDMRIPFREFLESIEAGPSDLRMFLFNIINHAPELREDYKFVDIMDGVYKEFPFMFFGGEGSKVALHYDIDLAHIFLSQFVGRKRIVLFPPEMSRRLYHHPFTVASYIDVNNPDYEKFPALRNAWGYDCTLHPGETIFMPSGHWHYIEYTDTGFSMNQRANESYVRRAKGLVNIARHFVVDKGMNKLMGQDWRKIKEDLAKRRAEDALVDA
ncbi:MAG: cupin-like domain-containing protein [Saprospiraceae bacterium]|nr:cupin-like domain-containing protein [Saprospiraceae bacterium]